MSAHTPGPWARADRVVMSNPEAFGYLTWIADCSVGGESLPMQEANARLIAAAPDLLEALQRLIPLLDHDVGGKAGSVLHQAIEAVAKATQP